MDRYIGVDLGTSGVRVEVFDRELKSVLTCATPLARNTVAEWERALSYAFAQCGPLRGHIAVDSTSGTFLLVGPRGEVVAGPFMYYEEARDEWEEMRRWPETVALEEFGSASPIAKLYRLAKTSLLRRARWVVPAATWVTYMLCGDWREVYVDYGNALRLGLDIYASPPRWRLDVLEKAGVDPAQLPTPAESGRYVCEASGPLAERLGVVGSAVYLGTTDGNASAVASGALELGDASVTSGSTTVVKYVAREPVKIPGVYYHVHPLGGFLAGAATAPTGVYLQKLSEAFGIPIEEALEFQGDEYLFFPPGYRSPFDDPALRGALLKFDIDPAENPRTVAARLIRSVALGLVLTEYSILNFLGRAFGSTPPRVGVAGGGGRSRRLNELRASIYGVEVASYSHSATLGVVLPVLLRTGAADRKKIRELVKPDYVVGPSPRLAEMYRGVRERYVELWKKLGMVYRLI